MLEIVKRCTLLSVIENKENHKERVGRKLSAQSIVNQGAFHLAQWRRILLPVRETQVQSLGREDPLEKEMAVRSSIPAWEIPWTEEPGGLQSMESDTTQQVNNDNQGGGTDLRLERGCIMSSVWDVCHLSSPLNDPPDLFSSILQMGEQTWEVFMDRVCMITAPISLV